MAPARARCSTAPGRPRHRRRHRRFRGPGGRAGPPGHRRRPQPRRARGPRPPRRRGRRRRPGHRRSRATSPTCSTSSPAASADVVLCHGVLEVVADPAAALRHHRRGAAPRRHAQPARRPAARRRGGPGDGRPLPAGPAPCSTTRPPAASAEAGRRFTADEVAALLADAGFTLESRSTASGSSPTSSPAPCSTSSPAPPPPWSSSSAPSPAAPSTSRSPRRSTSSPRAETSRTATPDKSRVGANAAEERSGERGLRRLGEVTTACKPSANGDRRGLA